MHWFLLRFLSAMGLCTLTMMSSVVYAEEDRCGDVLRDGVFDRTAIQDRRAFAFQWLNLYRQTTISNESQSSGTRYYYQQGNRSDDASQSENSTRQYLNQIASQNSGAISENREYIQYLTRANSALLEAWSDCMKGPGLNIGVRRSANPNEFWLVFQYNSSDERNSSTNVTIETNQRELVCRGAQRITLRVGRAQVPINCRRTTNTAPVSLQILTPAITSRGVQNTFYLAAVGEATEEPIPWWCESGAELPLNVNITIEDTPDTTRPELRREAQWAGVTGRDHKAIRRIAVSQRRISGRDTYPQVQLEYRCVWPGGGSNGMSNWIREVSSEDRDNQNGPNAGWCGDNNRSSTIHVFQLRAIGEDANRFNVDIRCVLSAYANRPLDESGTASCGAQINSGVRFQALYVSLRGNGTCPRRSPAQAQPQPSQQQPTQGQRPQQQRRQ